MLSWHQRKVFVGETSCTRYAGADSCVGKTLDSENIIDVAMNWVEFL